MNRISAHGIVLKRVNYGEADRIVTFLTKHHGKISVMAKGVRKPKSKLAGGIELFSISSIGYIKGRSNLSTLTSSRVEQSFNAIAKDLAATEAAYDVIRIVNLFTDEDATEEYFDILASVFELLDTKPRLAPRIRDWGMMQIMRAHGSVPNLTHDAHGKTLKPDQTYGFSHEDGCFFPSDSGLFGAEEIKAWRVLLQASPQQLVSISGLSEPLQKGSAMLKTFVEYQA